MAIPFGSSGGSYGSNETAIPAQQEQNMPTKFLSKIYASGTTSADNILTFTMPRSARLVGMFVETALTAAASLTEGLRYEISLQSSSQFTQAEAANVLATLAIPATSSSAGQQTRQQNNILGMDVQLDAGAKIYVHRIISTVAPATATVAIIFYFA